MRLFEIEIKAFSRFYQFFKVVEIIEAATVEAAVEKILESLDSHDRVIEIILIDQA